MYTQPSTHTLKDLIHARGSRRLLSIAPEATAEAAIRLMEEVGISQLPVLADGKSVGSIQEVTLARVLHDGRDPATVSVGEIMARPLPMLDENIHLDEAYRLLLSGNTGVLITSDSRAIDIVTRIDLVHYWEKQRKAKASG